MVDRDIDADDLSGVWWALGTRLNPGWGMHIIKRGRLTLIDPALHPTGAKLITSRVVMNATIAFEWSEKPTQIKLSETTLGKVRDRWVEYGID